MIILSPLWNIFRTKKYAPVLITLAMFSVGATVSWHYTQNYYLAKISKIEAKYATEAAKTLELAISKKDKEITKLTGALKDVQEQVNQTRIDADAANLTNSRLRKSLADYRAKHSSTFASTGSCESSVDSIGVLAELLEGLADRGAEISRYADEVKIAGLACEKIHEQ